MASAPTLEVVGLGQLAVPCSTGPTPTALSAATHRAHPAVPRLHLTPSPGSNASSPATHSSGQQPPVKMQPQRKADPWTSSAATATAPAASAAVGGFGSCCSRPCLLPTASKGRPRAASFDTPRTKGAGCSAASCCGGSNTSCGGNGDTAVAAAGLPALLRLAAVGTSFSCSGAVCGGAGGNASASSEARPAQQMVADYQYTLRLYRALKRQVGDWQAVDTTFAQATVGSSVRDSVLAAAGRKSGAPAPTPPEAGSGASTGQGSSRAKNALLAALKYKKGQGPTGGSGGTVAADKGAEVERQDVAGLKPGAEVQVEMVPGDASSAYQGRVRQLDALPESFMLCP
eukprot:XP_001703589.1 predicted protein [Chlamydomonas reinhardtii]